MNPHRSLFLVILFSSIIFTNFNHCETDYALSMKIRLRTTSDWTLVKLEGIGELLLSNHTQSKYNHNVVTEDNHISIWIGKPQYDENLTQIEVSLVVVNPENITVHISKGYIGYTNIKVSAWTGENYRNINRITHRRTAGDQSHNRYSTIMYQKNLEPYKIRLIPPSTKQEKEVLAVYYPWYGKPDEGNLGRHWGYVNETSIQESPNYPLLGAYDSTNPSIINNHIEMARSSGITCFTVSWWGIDTYEDKAFKKLLNNTKNFKTCVYYETYRIPTPLLEEQVVSELQYIIKNYGSHPNYLRYNDKPVVIVFSAEGQSRDKDFWFKIRSRVDTCILIGDFRSLELLDVFDGVHIYNELDLQKHKHLTSWISNQNRRLVYDSIPMFNLESREGYIIYDSLLTVGTVTPGYDDTKIRVNGTKISRHGNETYRNYWRPIHEYPLDWVLITSWNEWHEGTEIEPSRENGYSALYETRKQVEKFMEINGGREGCHES